MVDDAGNFRVFNELDDYKDYARYSFADELVTASASSGMGGGGMMPGTVPGGTGGMPGCKMPGMPVPGRSGMPGMPAAVPRQTRRKWPAGPAIAGGRRQPRASSCAATFPTSALWVRSTRDVLDLRQLGDLRCRFLPANSRKLLLTRGGAGGI